LLRQKETRKRGNCVCCVHWRSQKF